MLCLPFLNLPESQTQSDIAASLVKQESFITTQQVSSKGKKNAEQENIQPMVLKAI